MDLILFDDENLPKINTHCCANVKILTDWDNLLQYQELNVTRAFFLVIKS